jgi:hypothetical protein
MKLFREDYFSLEPNLFGRHLSHDFSSDMHQIIEQTARLLDGRATLL